MVSSQPYQSGNKGNSGSGSKGNSGGNSGKSGGSTAGGNSGTSQASAGYSYFLWQTYEYEEDGGYSVSDVIVRVEFDDAAREMRLYEVDSDGSVDTDTALVMDYNPSTGTAVMSLAEEGASGSIQLSRNRDGSLSGVISASDEEADGTTYTKLTGLSGTPDSFRVSTTGETATYQELEYGDAEMTKQFFVAEAQHYILEHGLSFRYKDSGKETAGTSSPPVYRPPVTGKTDPPREVLEYYVKVEAQNRVREKATGQPQSHVTLPADWNISQSEFDAMVAEEMRGEINGQ